MSKKNIDLSKLFDDLFPICRSICGEGINQSLKIISRFMPFKINSVASGSEVFDWIIPKEWKLNRATLKDSNGKIVIDSNINNLHVLNFSEPFSGQLDLSDLKKNLYSIPEIPEAIPYVTSYYKERWGFCLSDNDKQKLKDDTYSIDINVEKKDGFLNYGICDLPGKTEDIFLISTYLCHPSMANNELSGPLAMVKLYDYLKNKKNREYSYKFIICPETIGSIAYLFQEKKKTLKKVMGGMVLTCLGGPEGKISFKLSRRDWVNSPSKIDLYARHLSKFLPNIYSIREFTPTGGSDERQYCSPKINLPIIQASKTVYGEYKEYHNSLDTKEFMRIKSVEESADSLIEFIECFEMLKYKVNSNIEGGEPMLSKRNLYPSIMSPESQFLSNDKNIDGRNYLNLMLKVLSLCDGTKDILGVAEKLSTSIFVIKKLILELVESQVVFFETK